MLRQRAAFEIVGFAVASALLCGVLLIARAPNALQRRERPPGPAATREPTNNSGQAAQAPQAGASRPIPPTGDEKNVFEGTGGDDSLKGGDGNDWLFGKEGNDLLLGGKGRDTIEGGAGDDTIDGGPDEDVIGGPDGKGNDTIRGGDGNDVLDGGDDDDFLDGGAGNDELDGGDGNDLLLGGAGDDVLDGGDGDDVLGGGAGADRLSGGEGADSLAGGPGDDILAGGDGDDSLAGDAGDDVLDGGQGNDVLRGGTGNDTLLGSKGADNLDGGEEHDTLLGGDGRDVLNGATGDDWLLGGIGTDIVNGGDGDDLIVLRAGDVTSEETEAIDGGGGNDVLILNGFNSSPTLAAEVRLLDPVTLGTYRLVNIERVEHTHLFTHFSTEPNRPASLLLINPSTRTASTGRVGFFSEDGSAATPAVGGVQAQGPIAFTVPPLGIVRVDAPAQDAARTGSAQVLASSPVGGVIRSVIPTLGPVDIAETALVDGSIVPVLEERASGASTGVVISSSAIRTGVRLTLYTAAGMELTTWAVDVNLPPYSHRVVFVRDMYPNLGDFQGTMTVEVRDDRPQDGGPMTVTAIQRTGSAGVFASYPAIPTSPLPAAQTLHFARFASGGEYVSALVLVNPSSSNRAKGTVSFFDDGGGGWPVSLTRQNGAATVPYDLAPHGSVVLTTPTGGPLRIGSARADVTEGVLSAVLRVSAPNVGLAGSDPSGAFEGFIAPARRDRSAGVNTDVAIASTGSAVSLQLTLRDANGTEVTGGAAQLRVPANGQVMRPIDEIFPMAATDNFQGTLTVTAEGGTVAASVTQVSGDSPRAAAMPVMSLR